MVYMSEVLQSSVVKGSSSISMPREYYDELKRHADRVKWSPSQLVREIIVDWLDKNAEGPGVFRFLNLDPPVGEGKV